MADRTIKPDDTYDLVLSNNDGSSKLELNEDQTVKITTGSDAGEDFTVNTTKLVVEGDTGNVGIGTAVPDHNLSVEGGGTDTQVFLGISAFNDQTLYSPDLVFRKSHNDTVGTKTSTTDNTILGRIIFNGVDSGSNFDWGAYIMSQQDGSAGDQTPAELSFYTSDGTSIAERMIIKKSGNVEVSTGNLVIGTAGKGIDFNVTGDFTTTEDEILNDYETGYYTPVLTAGSGTITNGTTYNKLYYVKVGEMVNISGAVQLIGYSGSLSGSSVSMTLPISAITSGQNSEKSFPGFATQHYDGSSFTTITGNIDTTTCYLRIAPATLVSATSGLNVYLYFSFAYRCIPVT